MKSRLPLSFRTLALLQLLGASLAFHGAACSLNPQPLPPVENGAAAGGDAGSSFANSGTAAGGDAGAARGDSGALTDAATNVPPTPGVDSGNADTSLEGEDAGPDASVDGETPDGGEAGAGEGGVPSGGAVDGGSDGGTPDAERGEQG
jgi:hypothetical protein